MKKTNTSNGKKSKTRSKILSISIPISKNRPVNKPKSPNADIDNYEEQLIFNEESESEEEKEESKSKYEDAEESGEGEGEKIGELFNDAEGDCKSEEWLCEPNKKISIHLNPTVSLPVPKTTRLSPTPNIVPPVPDIKLKEIKEPDFKIASPNIDSGTTANSRRRDV